MKYNPSVLPHATLEALFVGADRHKILSRIVASAEAATTTDQRNHTLLIGRRGAGKSHIIALAYHRTGELKTDKSRLVQRSWLPEDPLTIDSYSMLLRQIAERLSGTERQSFRRYDCSRMESWLDDRASTGGPIIVFVENLDQILDVLGETGQQQFRHYLQTSGSLLIVATTTTLSRDLSREAAPFYGFFTTTPLEPFDEHTASTQLAAIAHVTQNTITAEFVQSRTGLARLRAVAHLAGGQPRMWSTLGETLSPDDLDELIAELLATFDELTPYYQEQLARLSPLQRRIVGELAHADRPLTVDDLCHELENSSQTISKAINVLYKEKNWVKPCQTIFASFLDGRKTYYELAEPLARLIFQIKESRGEPIRLIIDFIKLWFDPEDIDPFSNDRGDMIAQYMEKALEDDSPTSIARSLLGLKTRSNLPRLDLLSRIDSSLLALSEDNVEPMMSLPTAVRLAIEQRLVDKSDNLDEIGKNRVSIHQIALAEIEHTEPDNRSGEQLRQWSRTASSIVDMTPEGIAIMARWAIVSGDFTKATALINDCGRIMGTDHALTLTTRLHFVWQMGAAGNPAKAIELSNELLDDLAPLERNPLIARGTILNLNYWTLYLPQAMIEELVTDLEQLVGHRLDPARFVKGFQELYHLMDKVVEVSRLNDQRIAVPNQQEILTYSDNSIRSFVADVEPHYVAAQVAELDHQLEFFNSRQQQILDFHAGVKFDERIAVMTQKLTIALSDDKTDLD